jgi:Flp pilus assembly protein TadG
MVSVSRLRERQDQFCRSERGSTAMIFALTVFAISGAAGLAIDSTRAIRAKEVMQDNLDSAVLAVGSARQSEAGDAADRLTAYMAANWKDKYGAPLPSTTLTEPSPDVIQATARTTMPTIFMRILGQNSISLYAEAHGRFGLAKAEVALALDITGSMTGSRMDALKMAAKDLVRDTYLKPGAATKITFSIVPFAQYVNVGMPNRSASWLSVPNDGMVTKTREVPINPALCVERTGTGYNDQGQPYSYQYMDCDGVPKQTETYSEMETWTGCVGSRPSPKDSQVLLNSANPVQGLMNTWCASPLQRLTNDESGLTSVINDLTPAGHTYMAPGVLWAWRTLSPAAPFADAAPAAGANRARKVIVLMSDGANTASQGAYWTGDWRPHHEGWNPGDANIKTKQVCDNAKADKIEVFAIAFEVTDPTALGLLQDCASSPVTHYFNATDNVKLTAAFKKVGESLSAVRLTK